MLKNEVRRRLKERGISMTIVDKDIGYELRCADPIPFDLEYTQDLGYAAVQYLLSGGTGAIVTIDRGSLIPISFESVMDPATGRARIREVDVDSDSYRVARRYMIRLDAADFSDPKSIARLATIGKMTPGDFESRFRYLVNDPPVRRRASSARIAAPARPGRRDPFWPSPVPESRPHSRPGVDACVHVVRGGWRSPEPGS
jgi:6-phosphofructokinase 1